MKRRALFFCFVLSLSLIVSACTGAPAAPVTDDFSVYLSSEEKTFSESAPPVFSQEETAEEIVIDRDYEKNMRLVEDSDPAFSCAKAIAWSSESGVLIRKGDRISPLYPASLTKLVTALTALSVASPDTECTAGAEMKLAEPETSIAYLPEGSRADLETLIEAMLLPSGCDAAYVIAANLGRILSPGANTAEAVAAFVDRMNEWSKENGLLHSHWTNPDGNHADSHYSCLEDMLQVMILSLNEPVILKCAALSSDNVTLLSGHKLTWKNTNRLIDASGPYYDPACFGLKTGQTKEAGGCLASAFRYGDEVVLIGVFGSGRYDYRFESTKLVLKEVTAMRAERDENAADAAR